jgi:hypothetical protein
LSAAARAPRSSAVARRRIERELSSRLMTACWRTRRYSGLTNPHRSGGRARD